MAFFCSACDVAIDAPYEWGGMPVACPACGDVAPLQHRLGCTIASSASGYGVTYRDFLRLLAEDLPRVDALVERGLGCRVRREGAVALVTPSGALLPLTFAHLRLQGDASTQRQLYDLAMDLWR